MKNLFLISLLFTAQLAPAQNFVELTQSPPLEGITGSMAFADVDGDGDSDLVISGQNSSLQRMIKLYLNDGVGNFTENLDHPFDAVTLGSIAFSDVDADGDSDLVVLGQNASLQRIAKLYVNDGAGHFTEKTGTPFQGTIRGSVAFADVDGDGDSDVLITGSSVSLGYIAKLYLNDGAGNFTEKTGTSFEGVWFSATIFSDMDGDGDPDLLMTGTNATGGRIAKLYLNDGGGNFTEKAGTPFEGVQNGSIAVSDVDGDGNIDVLISGTGAGGVRIARLYLNGGAGDFTEQPTIPFRDFTISSGEFSDIDNDGDSDLLITGIDSANVRYTKLYINDGLANFTEKMDTPFEGVHSGSVAFSDVDGDGDSDLLIIGWNDAESPIAKLYLNTGTTSIGDQIGQKLLDFVVYPNPGNANTLNLQFESYNHGQARVSLCDLAGRLLLQQQDPVTKGNTTITLNVSGLAQGVYCIRLVVGERSVNRKVVIQK